MNNFEGGRETRIGEREIVVQFTTSKTDFNAVQNLPLLLLNSTVTEPSSPVAPLVDHYLKHLRPELYIYVTRMSSGLHRNLLGFACNTVRTGDDAAAEPTATCAKRKVSPLCHKSPKPRQTHTKTQEQQNRKNW